MSKYDPLQRHLQRIPQARVPMSFEDVEAVLGFALPASSRRYPAWWSNNPANNVMTRAWLGAGFKTESVDIERGRLVFRRTEAGEGDAGLPKQDAPMRRGRHPFIGSMKGTVTVAPGTDLAAPADPDWGRLAYGDDG